VSFPGGEINGQIESKITVEYSDGSKKTCELILNICNDPDPNRDSEEDCTLTFISRADKTIVLSWKKCNMKNFNYYELFVLIKNQEKSIAKIYDQNKTTYEVKNLKPGEKYTFVVRVVTKEGAVIDSESLTVKTKSSEHVNIVGFSIPLVLLVLIIVMTIISISIGYGVVSYARRRKDFSSSQITQYTYIPTNQTATLQNSLTCRRCGTQNDPWCLSCTKCKAGLG
jgi:hypothetical protein